MLLHNQGVAEIVFVKLEPLAYELHIKNQDAKTDLTIDLHVLKVWYGMVWYGMVWYGMV